jgi:phytol kinase
MLVYCTKKLATILLMLEPILSLAFIGGVLVVSEILWNKGIMRDESSRKFVHIVVGASISLWPFFMPFQTIQVLSVLLLAGVVVSRGLNLFRSVHTVPRQTVGEVLFAISIGVVATLAHSKWIFTAAILHMSLADGLAAIAGTKAGVTKGYKIFGQRKTYIGTLTFYGVSLGVTTAVMLASGAEFASFALPIIVAMPIIVTALENLAVYGTDNLVVPVFVVLLLNNLQSVL